MNTETYLELIDKQFTEVEKIAWTREDCTETAIAELQINDEKNQENFILIESFINQMNTKYNTRIEELSNIISSQNDAIMNLKVCAGILSIVFIISLIV